MNAAAPLRTDRLLMRRWTAVDREPFAAMNADPTVTRFLKGPLGRAESDAFIDRIEAGFDANGYGLWAVEVQDSGQFIGFTGLARPTFDAPFTPAVEVGWRLTPTAWGHGYATEAARTALEYGFRTGGLDEVVSMTAAANARSRAVMVRLGMTRDPDEDFEHPLLVEGHSMRSQVLYRLSRTDWLGVLDGRA